MSSKQIIRRALAVLALAIVIVAPAVDIRAQASPNLQPAGAYQPIPKFTGVGAGAQFRKATSNGSTPFAVISPRATSPFLANGSNRVTAGWYYSSAPAGATVTNAGSSSLWASKQISTARAQFGPAAALLNGRPAASLASPSLSGTTLLANVTASSSISGRSLSAPPSAMNINGTYNVQAYGARGNGKSHDDVGSQAAIDAACTAGTPATIVFPAASNYYDLSSPLFVHCSNLHILGPAIGSNSNQILRQDPNSPGGPIFVLQPYSMSGVTLGSPLISSSRHSFSFKGSPRYYINLGDASNFNISGSSAFTSDGYVQFTDKTAAGELVTSSGRRTSSVAATFGYRHFWDGSHFNCWVNVSGKRVQLQDTTTTVSNGTLYHSACTFDGSTVRLFTNGSLVASQPQSGTITQPYWEVPILGGLGGDFPEGRAIPIYGLMDGWRVSRTARWTSSFTPCYCEPTNDSNTVVIASADQNLHMLTQLQWQDAGGHDGWSYVRRLSEDSGANEQGLLGIEIDSIGVGGRKGSIGIIGQQINASDFRHVGFYNTTSGIWLYNNDFENSFENDTVQTSYIGIYNGGQSGLNTYYYPSVVGGMIGFRGTGGPSVVLTSAIVQQSANMVWAYSVQGDTGFGYFNCFGCGLDAENCGANWLGTLQLDNVETTSWNGGALAACPGTPTVEIDGGNRGGSVTFTGTNFSPTGTSPEIIHVSGSNLPGIATVIGASKGAAVQWTDSPADVVIQPCKGNVTLSGGAGSFSDTCIMTSAVCTGQDTTTASDTFVLGAPSAGRQVSDGVENGTTTLTSATASFVSGDLGRKVEGANVPAGTKIASVTNGTTIMLSHATTARATSATITLDGLVPITAGTGTDVIRVRCE